MKNEKRLIILTSFLFLSVFLLGITSAVAALCQIETNAATCEATIGGNVVMYVSGSTNAHGELESLSSHRYSKVLCCNFGEGSTSCSADNKIIGLSSSTNAHAEIPQNSNYNSNVCYDSLVGCFPTTSNCASNELEVLRLSSSTNAHISGPGQGYNTKICCTVSVPLQEPPLRACEDGIDNDGDGLVDYPADPGCTSASDNDETDALAECEDGIDNDGDGLVDYPADPGCTSLVDDDEINIIPPVAFWSNSNFREITFLDVAPDSTNVRLVLENSGFSQGTNLDFDIREREFGPDTQIRTVSGTTDSNERVVATWTITQEDLDTATDFEEFYFRVDGEQSGSLTLNLASVDCGLVVTCNDYEQTYCESDICNVAEFSVPGSIDCSDSNINCYCIPNGNACAGAFSSSTSTTPPADEGDGIISIGETCDGSNWGPITGCTDFDEFTGGTLSCESPGRFDTSLCTGGNGPGVLGDGIINPGETCDGSNWGGITGCTDFDEFTGGALSCDSTGHFDTSQCVISGDGIINIGETCDGSNWGGITGCTDFDEFTGGALSCDSTGHFDTSACTGGNGPGTYGDGIINLGETCDGSNWGGITGCTDFDEFVGGVLSCEDPGNFNTFQCIGIDITKEIGTCLITEGDADANGCDDGFLTISWTGQWIWNEEENPGHSDPKGLSLLCVEGGTRVIECPTQIKLPFFGFYNILITILLITIIYFILIRKNNKKH